MTRVLPWTLCAGLTVLLAGCQTPPQAPEPTAFQPLGVIEVSFDGLGGDQPVSTVRPLALPEQVAGIQLQALSLSVFDVGSRNAGGIRYITATYRVRNAAQDGTASTTARQNLTLLAVGLNSNADGTAFRGITTFGGGAVAVNLARSFRPTHALNYLPTAGAVQAASGGEDLQVFTETEVLPANFTRSGAPATSYADLGVDTVFPYGYVVRNVAGGRQLPANPAVNQYDGRVALSVRVPLQPDDAQQTPTQGSRRDPWAFKIAFLVVTDPVTRVTQSLEDQGLSDAVMLTRATAASASEINILPGSSYASNATRPSRRVCQVRTAGLAGSQQAAYLVNTCP